MCLLHMRNSLQLQLQPLMLICCPSSQVLNFDFQPIMTDSMNFGPEWLLRNLQSDNPSGGGSGARYQLAEHRYGREEMLALYEKGLPPPRSIINTPIYSELPLPPLALVTPSEEERSWQPRVPPNSVVRGRGGSLERGARGGRGRGGYQVYGRTSYDSGGGWGNNGEQSEWSPRKDFTNRSTSMDNWRRNRYSEEDDVWRASNAPSRPSEKWARQTSWRDGDLGDDRVGGPQDRGGRGWHEGSRGLPPRRSWDDDNLPEWATENLAEGGGTFDATGAFHGSDDEQSEIKENAVSRREIPADRAKGVGGSQVYNSESSKPSKADGSRDVETTSVNSEETKIKLDRSEPIQEKPNLGGSHTTNDTPKENLKDPIPKHEVPVKDKSSSNCTTNGITRDALQNTDRVDEDFDKLQEDLVLKLMVDEDAPKSQKVANFDVGNVQSSAQPPPNLTPPQHDKWYYQDPQGDTQGPFLSSEMAEWFRAGYFATSLMIKRHCDDHFYQLGELVSMCVGNPFLSNIRIAPQKMNEPDALQFQLLQTQMALRQATAMALSQTEPWNTLTALQQRELVTQQMMAQSQMGSEMPFLQQQQTGNPLLHMINQMQQSGKLPGHTIPTKPSNPVPTVDPIQAFVQQMGNLQSLHNHLPSTPTGLPGVLQPGGMNPAMSATLPGDLPGFQNAPNLSGVRLPMTSMPPTLGSTVLPGNLPVRPPNVAGMDPLNSGNDPIKDLLRQLQSQKQQQQNQQQLDSVWQQNQFTSQAPPPPQWQQSDVPISMWDLQAPPTPTAPSPPTQVQAPPSEEPQKTSTKPAKQKKETAKSAQSPKEPVEEQLSVKEQKKKKEAEEKQAKKEQEEKRKLELKKQEMEKKAAEEKKRKEQEKAKKEAEEKRLRELEEKRRLKEQRKAEEARKKADEEKKRVEEEQRLRWEAKEKEQKKQAAEAAAKQAQANSISSVSKAAPWSQSNTTLGTSLEEIQKAERQKRAEQAALLQQQRALQQQQQQQQQLLQQQQIQQEQQQSSEKPTTMQLKWANKPVEPRKVKSLAEIQAEEEHQRLAKLAEQRLSQQKDKESAPVAPTSIWSGQNLTWANNASSQFSNNGGGGGGFWDEVASQKSSLAKPSTITKSLSSGAVSAQMKPKQKPKPKKEEQQVLKVFSSASAQDDFTEWCIKALADINSSVDVPTFVTFLRDIESAMDVREYCKEYLGEGPVMQQFASEFLEKRRLYKPKANQYKDDMCSPAPAITPAQHVSTEFQEVKGKGKKTKKSKMTKVDSRILGFNVTAAQDRINVGDLERIDNL